MADTTCKTFPARLPSAWVMVAGLLPLALGPSQASTPARYFRHDPTILHNTSYSTYGGSPSER